MLDRVSITLPSGGAIESFWRWPGAEINIQGHTFYTDLIIIELSEFDVILGMDWLSRHQVRLDVVFLGSLFEIQMVSIFLTVLVKLLLILNLFHTRLWPLYFIRDILLILLMSGIRMYPILL